MSQIQQQEQQQHEVLHKNAGLKRHLNSANHDGFSCFWCHMTPYSDWKQFVKKCFSWEGQLWRNVTFQSLIWHSSEIWCTLNKAGMPFFNAHQIQKWHWIGNLQQKNIVTYDKQPTFPKKSKKLICRVRSSNYCCCCCCI